MEKIDLRGNWTLRADDEIKEYPITIPGDNITALYSAGVIPDPYFGKNELDIQWIGRKNWILEKSFFATPEFVSGENIFFYVNRLDTCADVYLNGQLLGKTRNMFREYRFDCKKALVPGENKITVKILSAEIEACKQNDSLPYEVPHTIYPVQSPHRNLIRKVQCHSGWDWGPCLMVSGIYGDVYIGATELERIDAVYTDMSQSGNNWKVNITVELYSWKAGKIQLKIKLAGKEKAKPVALRRGTNVLKETVIIENPLLWWPAGYGKQSLYELTVKTPNDSVTKKIGFRSLEIINKEDTVGRSFTIKINGREIFAKGANWIPADALPGRISSDRTRRLLEDAVSANMNTIRVWGGGQYESDQFYSQCDELGLLVWQDFMFSCSLYPANQEFLDNVREEIRYQVKRLKSNPCIAIWCGNNEDIGALTWFEASRQNRDRYIIDYDRLNEGVIGTEVRRLDPGRAWWPSSPSAGAGDYSDNWHDDSRGDMHYWSVWHEGKPFEAYYEVIPRFCSEFGFQSLPSRHTTASFAPPEQWNVTSPLMDHHQRSPRGNSVIITTLSWYFRFPQSFEHFLFLSEVQQAMAIQMAVDYWRACRPICMGVLYWQLNDVWPCASWSSIEYSGRWKLLHYAARRFYRPVHLALINTPEGKIQVWGLNDTANPVSGTLRLRFLDFDGSVKEESSFQVGVEPDSSQLFKELLRNDIPGDPCSLFLTGELEIAGAESIYASLLLEKPKYCELGQARVNVDFSVEDNSIVLLLTTSRPAFFVTLDTPDPYVRFSDNGFILLPDKPRKILVDAKKKIDFQWLKENLSVIHLRETY